MYYCTKKFIFYKAIFEQINTLYIHRGYKGKYYMGLQKVALNFMVKSGDRLVKSCLCIPKPPKNFSTKGLKYIFSTNSVASMPKPQAIKEIGAVLNQEQIITNAQKAAQNSFAGADEIVHSARYYSQNNVIRMSAGKEFKGFKGLYSEDKKICCYVDDSGKIYQSLMLDNKTGEIRIIDYINKIEQYYSKADVEALHYYKYHPDGIHSKLRYGKNKFSGSFQEEVDNTIKKLEDIFADNTKITTNNKRKTLYRALQDILSDEDIAKLNKVGSIIEDKSFCSTTTDLNAAKRFAHGNTILEIDFPKDAKYLDMDKIFNIDRQHWNEGEFLLNKGAKFQVTGFDSENNIIKVRYLL